MQLPTEALPPVLGIHYPSTTVWSDLDGFEGVSIVLPDDAIHCVICGKFVGKVLSASNPLMVRSRCVMNVTRGKSSTSHHSISGHIPKCRGTGAPSVSGTTPVVQCDACGRSFRSKWVLSTHERHIHPDVRNRARIGLDHERAGTKA